MQAEAGPVIADVTGITLLMVTSSFEDEQLPLEIVHLKVFAPDPNPVRPEVGLDGDVIVPDPLINVHIPEPTVGVLPAKVAVVAHTF